MQKLEGNGMTFVHAGGTDAGERYQIRLGVFAPRFYRAPLDKTCGIRRRH